MTDPPLAAEELRCGRCGSPIIRRPRDPFLNATTDIIDLTLCCRENPLHDWRDRSRRCPCGLPGACGIEHLPPLTPPEGP